MKTTFIALFFFFISQPFIIATNNPGKDSLPAGLENKEFRKNFNIAREYFDYGLYKNALRIFKYLLKYDPENSNLNYYAGICYLEMKGKKTDALPFLKIAAKRTNINYKNTHKEKNAPVFAFYYLGEIYHMESDFEKAISNFKKFRSYLSNNDHEFLMDVNYKISLCVNASKLISNQVKVKTRDLDFLNQMSWLDYGSIFCENGEKIYFSRKRKGQNGNYRSNIYSSEKKGNQWTRSKSLTWINSPANDEICQISEDGNLILFTSDRDGEYNLYISRKINQSKWTKPEKLQNNINSKYDEKSGWMSDDGNILYFSSNRKNGYGGYDLYVVYFRNGKWSEPIILGSNINTVFDEEYPFYDGSNNRLFFSSQGHESMGGYDIFYSEKIDGIFSKPINIGYPINNVTDEISFKYNESNNLTTYTIASDYDQEVNRILSIAKVPFQHGLKKTDYRIKNTSDYIASRKEKEEQYILKKALNQEKKYTIQVAAGELEENYFSRLRSVVNCRGNDGIMRYFVGRFSSREEAESYLKIVRRLGYPDAWVALIDPLRAACLDESDNLISYHQIN